jgi:hypothetical protein
MQEPCQAGGEIGGKNKMGNFNHRAHREHRERGEGTKKKHSKRRTHGSGYPLSRLFREKANGISASIPCVVPAFVIFFLQ